MGAALPLQAQHYTALAREAELLKALREACAEIEQWAAHAFRSPGNSQVEFEQFWRADDKATFAKWEALKTVAGLPLTDWTPEPVECEE